MTTICQQLNQEQLNKLGKAKEELAKNDKKRMYNLFEKLQRMMYDRKVKFTKHEKKINDITINDTVYVPTVKNGMMMLFKASEIAQQHKHLIDAEQFFPGIND